MCPQVCARLHSLSPTMHAPTHLQPFDGLDGLLRPLLLLLLQLAFLLHCLIHLILLRRRLVQNHSRCRNTRQPCQPRQRLGAEQVVQPERQLQIRQLRDWIAQMDGTVVSTSTPTRPEQEVLWWIKGPHEHEHPRSFPLPLLIHHCLSPHSSCRAAHNCSIVVYLDSDNGTHRHIFFLHTYERGCVHAVHILCPLTATMAHTDTFSFSTCTIEHVFTHFIFSVP